MADKFFKKHANMHIILVLLALAPLALTAAAQPADSTAPAGTGVAADFWQRHPPGSIQSIASANALLADAVSARQSINSQYAENQRACMPQFFVNKCMDIAKEKRRVALGKLRALEVEANQFKRRERVVERDRALDEARAKEAATPVIPGRTRTEKPPPPDAKPGSPKPGTAKPDAVRPDAVKADIKSAPATSRQREHDDKLQRRQASESDDAKKRAANIEAFEAKARKSEARQREIETKRIDKENQKRAKLAKEAAAK